MSIQNQLSYSLGLKTQEGNKALAKAIAESEDSSKLNELIHVIESKPIVRLQMDAMLTIAYIAESNPEMVVQHVDFLIGKLDDPINRVIFGSMIALSHISNLALDKMYYALPKILDAMDKGTVVTRDYGFRILINLYRENKYSEDVFYIISNQITLAPSNQLGQYTERVIPEIKENHKQKLIDILEERNSELSNEHHLKRLQKNLKKLYK